MLKLFRIFASAKGTNPWLVLSCLILASVAEIISLSAMLPALLAVSGESSDLPPAFKTVVDATLAVTGLPDSIGGFTIAVGVMLTLRSVLLGAALTYAGFSIADVSTKLRENLLNAMFDTKWRYFVDHRAGRIANTISVDATRAGQAYLEAARFVAAAVQGVGYFAIAMMASFKFAIAGVIAGTIIVAGLGKLIAVTRRRRPEQYQADQIDGANSTVHRHVCLKPPDPQQVDQDPGLVLPGPGSRHRHSDYGTDRNLLFPGCRRMGFIPCQRHSARHHRLSIDIRGTAHAKVSATRRRTGSIIFRGPPDVGEACARSRTRWRRPRYYPE